MKIGYIRYNTEESLWRQVEVLSPICNKIYKEKLSGLAKERPELIKLIHNLKEGDIVVVKDAVRLSRTPKDIFSFVEQIKLKGARIESIDGSLDNILSFCKYFEER